MNRSFAVSVGNERIKLDAEGHGEISFTVTNNSTRPVRGRARLVPLGTTKTEWLKIDGELERSFAAGATDYFIVHLAIPKGTPAGQYSFRLDVISAAEPQEDFTEGPVVAADVEVTEKKDDTFPWWILIAAGVVLAVGLTAYFLLRPDDKPVVVEAVIPPVSGLSEAEARTKLEELCDPRPCLQVTSNTEPNGEIPKGHAVRTEPPANAKVSRGSDVGLVLSGGPATVSVPDIFNLPEETAKQRLETFCQPQPCFKVTVIREGHGEVSHGRAIRTSPEKDTPVSPGSNLILVISQLVSSGERALLRQQTLDLDTGTLRGPSSQADLWLNTNGGMLEPGLDAGRQGRSNRFVAFGHTSPLGPNGCGQRVGAPTGSQVGIPLAQVSIGMYGCVVTTDNNVAEIHIVSKTNESLSVEYKTWPRSKKGVRWWDSRILRDALRGIER